MLFAFIIYGIIAAYNHPSFSSSEYPYFNYLADAFLHGQLNLRLIPSNVRDLVYFQGNYFLYWPPFPAILLIPFVAIFGVGFSDVLFTLFMAVINVYLVAQLLRQACLRGIIQLSDTQRALLVMFFSFGTVHITLAPFGTVWFTSQIVSFTCMLIAYWAVLRFRGWLTFLISGFAISAAFMTRSTLILIGIWPAIYSLHEHGKIGWKRLAAYCSLGLLPIIIAISTFCLYNYARFGSVTEFGYTYHLMNPVFENDYLTTGAFNLRYLPTNLFYQYVSYPFPIRANSLMGGSLFLLSPVFVAAVWGFFVGKPRWSVWGLTITIFMVNIPIVLLMGTGWMQFGPRYTLDFTVPLLLLTALGLQKWPDRIIFLLTILSIVQYIAGTIILTTIF